MSLIGEDVDSAILIGTTFDSSEIIPVGVLSSALNSNPLTLHFSILPIKAFGTQKVAQFAKLDLGLI
jgi:hypothetical protein